MPEVQKGENASVGVFVLGSQPKGVSWIKKLSSTQLESQCLMWGVQSGSTADENRVILRKFLLDHGQATDNTDSEKDEIKGADQVNHPIPSGGEVAGTSSDGCESQPQVTAPADFSKIILDTAVAIGNQIALALSSKPSTSTSSPSVSANKIVGEMISSLRVTNGVNAYHLVKFLVGFKKIYELGLIDFKSLLLLTLPKTDGQLKSLWGSQLSNELANYCSVTDEIHMTFLQSRTRQELITTNIYRVQRFNESLADFVTEVQDFVSILMPQADQDTILDILLTGLNPQTRARLAGFPAPDSPQRLLQLAAKVAIVQSTERQATERPNYHRYPVNQYQDRNGPPQNNFNRNAGNYQPGYRRNFHSGWHGNNGSREAFQQQGSRHYQNRDQNFNGASESPRRTNNQSQSFQGNGNSGRYSQQNSPKGPLNYQGRR